MRKAKLPGPLRKLRGAMQRNLPLLITCGEVEEFIQDYLADALPAGIRRKFDLHIRICRECKAYLRAYKRTIELGRAAFDDPDEAVSESVPEDLVQAILAARDPS